MSPLIIWWLENANFLDEKLLNHLFLFYLNKFCSFFIVGTQQNYLKLKKKVLKEQSSWDPVATFW